MNTYERSISLKTIYLTLIRRWPAILLILVPIVAASYLVTQFAMTKTYQSTTTVSNTAVITTAQYSAFSAIIKDKTTTIPTVATNLKAKKVYHADKTAVTESEIASGISITSLASNSVYITFSFQSTDSAITQPVLAELADVSVAQYIATLKGLKVYSPASKAVKNSGESKYFLIASAIGLVIALAVPFVYEIVADEVYDDKDLINMGIPACQLKLTKWSAEAK